MIRHPPDVGLADTENCNSPSKAPLAEGCCSCAILAVLCASTLICGQAAWETHDVSQDSPDDSRGSDLAILPCIWTHTSRRLLLNDDLNVGRRFTSATHAIDEALIKTFAVQFDPQPFHNKSRSERTSKAWQRAAGTLPRLRCVSMSRAVLRSPAAFGAGGELNWPATGPGNQCPTC